MDRPDGPDAENKDVDGPAVMTECEIRRLQASFHAVEPLVDQVAECFYRTLFALAPDLASRFDTIDMTTQGRMVMQAVGVTINGLDDPEALRSTLASLGCRHINYGVEDAHYAVTVEALLTTFETLLGDAFDPSLAALWRRALDQVTAIMIEEGRALQERTAQKTAAYEATIDEADHSDYLSRFMPEMTASATAFEGEAITETAGTQFSVDFVGDKPASAGPLQSILDISMAAGIAHACECGGKGKCTTCRVVVLDGLQNCLPRNQPETRIAQVKGFPPELRLACQTRVSGPVKVKRLVHDATDIDEVVSSGRSAAAREMTLAVLFADIRGFTTFSEINLPYDIVHALNRFFVAVGETIDQHQGYIDKYIGDGVMALFGLNPQRRENPCVDAVLAAVGMLTRLREVNAYMSAHLDHTFRIGIGVHYGSLVVGEVGFKLRRQFTAIGDTVNVAARLEEATKQHDADILISESVRQELPDDLVTFGTTIEIDLKGKTQRQRAHTVLAPSA